MTARKIDSDSSNDIDNINNNNVCVNGYNIIGNNDITTITTITNNSNNTTTMLK